MLVKPNVNDGGVVRRLGPGDVLAGSELMGTLTTVGAGTITGALFNNSLIKRTGATAAFTDTTDTAANIIAAVAQGIGASNVQNGTSWRLRYLNTLGFTCTIAAGTNVSLVGQCNVHPLSTKEFLVTVLNGTATQVFTGTTVNASKVITGMTAAQTALLTTGMAISGTGIPASTLIASIQPGIGVTTDTNSTADGSLISLTFAPRVSITSIFQELELPDHGYVAITAGTSTLSAGDMTGARNQVLNCSGQAAITLTTRTADQMIADIPNAQIGMTWNLRVLNRNSNTLTMSAGSGVTITGTATLATVLWKDFICTYTAASTIVMQVAASALL